MWSSLIALLAASTTLQPATGPAPDVEPHLLTGAAVTPGDYPDASIRANEHGTTGIDLTVGADGRVEKCVVTASSGFTRLDETTCRLATARWVYSPALLRGQPVRATVATHVRWMIPNGPSAAAPLTDYEVPAIPAGERGRVELELQFDATGKVVDCKPAQSAPATPLTNASCHLARSRFKFAPVLQEGHPVAVTRFVSMDWRHPNMRELPTTPATTTTPVQ